MTIKVRPANESDLPALTDLFLQGAEYHIKNAPDRFRCPTSEWSRTFLTEHLRNKNVTFLVAELNSRVVGEIRAELRKSPDLPLFSPQNILHVEEVVVDSNFRRRGIARTLMSAIEETARTLEADQIVLNVWAFNESAKLLYSELGYDVQRTVLKKDFA